RDAHRVGQLDLPDREIDVLLAHVLVGRQERLVRREVAQAHPVEERPALERLEGGVGLVLLLHLPVEDLDTVEAHLRGQVDAGGDAAELGVAAELPERVGGDGNAVWPRGWPVLLGGAGQGEPGRGSAGSGGEEGTAVEGHGGLRGYESGEARFPWRGKG